MTLLGRQFFQLGLVSLATYPLGFLIQLLMSSCFGTSVQVDAYWVVLTLVNLVGFFVHPVREAIVSGYHLRRAQGQDAADRYFSSAVNLVVLALLAGSVLLYCAPRFFATLVAGSGSGRLLDEVVHVLYYAVPLVTLVALGDIFSGLLISTGRILFQDLGRLFGSALAVVCLWTLAGRVGIVAMIAAALVSNLLMVGVHLLALRKTAFTYRLFSMPRIDASSLNMSAALVICYLASQCYVLYERNVFVGFGEGALSAFQYAVSLNNVCYAVCIGNLCNVLWPRLIAPVAGGDDTAVRGLLAASLGNATVLIAFSSLFLWCYAEPVTYLLFYRGRFDAHSLALTTGFFRAVLCSLPFLALSGIVGRLLVTRQETGYIFAVGIVNSAGGLLVLFLARVAQSPSIAGYHTAVSAGCGAAVSAWAAYRLYLRQPAGKAGGALLWWGCRALLPVLFTLWLFLWLLPLQVAGSKGILAAHLLLRLLSGGVLFLVTATLLGLLGLGDGWRLILSRSGERA
jgi:putative peptidoglycan lipid II flippase